jgi:hypothetical protein
MAVLLEIILPTTNREHPNPQDTMMAYTQVTEAIAMEALKMTIPLVTIHCIKRPLLARMDSTIAHGR